jgi:hypothetical protein
MNTKKRSHRIDLAILLASLAHAPLAAASTDYNNDGKDDIAFHRPGSTWNSMPVLLGNGANPWGTANTIVPAWANQPDVVALPGDYNADGRSDVAFHRPGGAWGSVPVLFGAGNGSWTSTNFVTPTWAHEPGVIALTGDYNADGRTDIAFHRPGSTWTAVPILFASGNGSWNATSQAAPSWANQPGAIALPGDYNADGRADIAFHRPGSTWNTVPVLFSAGNGTWTSSNSAASFANQPDVVALPGDYNTDGRTDLAFHRPGSSWGSLPVLFASGTGTWSSSNAGVPSWANQAGVIGVVGDYDANGRADIAFHRPGGGWNSAPVLRSNGSGGWTASNVIVPAWANQAGAIALRGDYNGDGRSDIAFHRRDTLSSNVPVLFASGNGSWSSASRAAPAWANQSGVRAVQPHLARRDPRENILDSGDAAYDRTPADGVTFRDAFAAFAVGLRWPDSGPIIITPPISAFEGLQDDLGLTGSYDGTILNGSGHTRVYASLRDFQGETHGTLMVLEDTLEFTDGTCRDVTMPRGTRWPVHMTSSGPTFPSSLTERSRFDASGSTTREVSMFGLFSGEMVIDFDVYLLNMTPQLDRSWLFGTIEIDVPWPCQDQQMAIMLERRNGALYSSFNYQ